MMKRLLVILACLGLGASMSGCTSNDSKQDTEVTSDYDSSQLETIEGDGSAIAADSSSTDQLPEQALGEVAPTDTSSDLAVAPETPMDSSSPLVDAPAETPADTTIADSSTTTDLLPPASAENTTVLDSAPSETPSEPPPKAASVPLQKAATTPWKVGKTLYNGIYFARPGDSLESISQNIYGADKTAELRKGNPTYNSRDVKPGDKVYYNSPQRPDDETKILTFQEDHGIAPQIYTAKSGDNIRKVSKEILGYDQAWKEVWASNEVASKGAIDEGTQLRYWPGAAAASVAATTPPPAAEIPHNDMAMNTPPAQELPAPPPAEMPAQQAMNDFPPPPPAPDMAQELPPPPPPPADMAQNDMALPPPPPPPAQMNPPPVAKEHHAEPAQGMDSDTTMALAAVGLAAAGLAALIVIRKKRKQREMDQVMQDTQVGT